MSRRIPYEPSDDTHLDRPGVIDQERDFVDQGRHLALEPDHPERTKKGDLGWRNAPAPRPLSSPGGPFKNLKGGK